MDVRRRRQAENELLFRRVNEGIEDMAETTLGAFAEQTNVWDFVCECHNRECTERAGMTLSEYEAVRAHGRRFVVAPAAEHVDTEIENVVDMSSRYWVVEKTDESGDLAAAEDPRDD